MPNYTTLAISKEYRTILKVLASKRGITMVRLIETMIDNELRLSGENPTPLPQMPQPALQPLSFQSLKRSDYYTTRNR